MAKKLSYYEVKKFIEEDSESNCKLLSEIYIDRCSPLEIQCSCGNTFTRSYDKFKHKSQQKCDECKNKRIVTNKKWSFEDVKKFIEIESNSGCKLLSSYYINNKQKLDVVCECGEIFHPTFKNFKYNNQRLCNKCSLKKQSEKQRHSYNYVKNFIETNTNCKLISNEYKSISSKLNLLCECGEEFKAPFSDFKSNNRTTCNKCSTERTAQLLRFNYEYVKQYIEVDSNTGCKLITKKDDYLNTKTKIKIKCKCGDDFNTTFYDFKNSNKYRCNKCSHLHTYTYSSVKEFIENTSGSNCKLLSDDYINMKEPLKIQCSCGEVFKMSFDRFKNSNKRSCDYCYNKTNPKKKIRITTRDIKEFIEFESSSGCKLISTEIKNTRSKLDIKCKCGEIFTTTYGAFVGKNKRCCNYCTAKRLKFERQVDYYIKAKNFIEKESNSGCELISDNYENSRTPLIIKCSCGELFEASWNNFKHDNKRACDTCSNKNIKNPLIYKCGYCGNDFKPRKKNQKCCSKSCSEKLKNPPIFVECAICKSKLRKTKSAIERTTNFFCSKECRKEWYRFNLLGENNPNYKNKSYEGTCDYCGNTMIIKEYGDLTKKNNYCSQECKSEHQKVILLGENNPNFGNRGSKNPLYRHDLTEEDRADRRTLENYNNFIKSVYKRDNYTCQICGQKKSKDVKIVAHHKDGYNWAVDRRTDVDNGATLCECCHIEFHKIYGFGDNTEEQYYEFMNMKHNQSNHINQHNQNHSTSKGEEKRK